MPDIDEVRGTLTGTGGVILDGTVVVASAGKWRHQRYEPQAEPAYWVTTIDGVTIPRGTYRLKLRFGDYVADMRRASYDGTRFTGPGAAIIRKEAAA